jgi:NitT/TauT family transport system substrate-binding protein
MRKYWRRVINLLALGIVNCFYVAAPAIGADVIKFALPGNSIGYLPLFVAVHRGFFKDEGLDIELPRLIPAMAQNALLAGEVQYHGLADCCLRRAVYQSK